MFDFRRLTALLSASLLLLSACTARESSDAASTTSTMATTLAATAVAPETTTTTEPPPVEPVRGGTLVYGISADTAGAWTHYDAGCALSCRLVLRSVTDSIFINDEAGRPVPYLLDDATPSADFTSWTFTVRPGIRFHDGTRFDAEALAYNLRVIRASPAAGQIFGGVEGVDVENSRTVVVRMKGPWSAFPSHLTDVAGMMFSPTWLKSLETNPLRNRRSPLFERGTEDVEIDGDPTTPIGLGPYLMTSYQPGTAGSVVVERFDRYWRGDGIGSTAEGLPLLDAMRFEVEPTPARLVDGLRSGRFDAIATDDDGAIADLRELTDELTTVEAPSFASVDHVLFNLAAGDLDPRAENETSPLLDHEVRRALAHALDRSALPGASTGVRPVAEGPFAPGTPGHLSDAGFPAHDPETARRLVDAHLAEVGDTVIVVPLTIVDSPEQRALGGAIVEQWNDVFGDRISTELDVREPDAYVERVLEGSYRAALWRNHGGGDPDEQFVWWNSLAAAPLGVSALNVGRFVDEGIDRQLTVLRTGAEGIDRARAAEAITRRFADQVPAIWLQHRVWTMAADPLVRDIPVLTSPTGQRSAPLVAGAHQLAQLWCWEGSCEG